jgi:hypothetical protein
MLQFLSKESEVGTTMLRYLELRRDYHEDSAKKISEQIEHFQDLLSSPTVASPIFGCALGKNAMLSPRRQRLFTTSFTVVNIVKKFTKRELVWCPFLMLQLQVL